MEGETHCPRRPTRQRYLDTQCNCRSQIAQAVRKIPDTISNVQDESLFFKLPGEIRNEIYRYVFAEQDSACSDDFDQAAPYYRPDFIRFQYIDTTMLRTCKRVYQETYWFILGNVRLLRIWLGPSDTKPCT
jgi:hypothetical protein